MKLPNVVIRHLENIRPSTNNTSYLQQMEKVHTFISKDIAFNMSFFDK